MYEFPVIASLGFLLLGFVLGVVVYPSILGWARRTVDEYRGGKCSYCGRETYVVPCTRCKKDVAFCHYYAVLGTDVPGEARLRKRRSNQICTKCLSAEEESQLESLLSK